MVKLLLRVRPMGSRSISKSLALDGMAPVKFGTKVLSIRRQRDDQDYFDLRVVVLRLYLILVLYENDLVYSESLGSLLDARKRAVELAGEWYKRDSIASFGKYQLETFDEMEEYYRSDAYFDSRDGVHIVIESLDITV